MEQITTGQSGTQDTDPSESRRRWRESVLDPPEADVSLELERTQPYNHGLIYPGLYASSGVDVMRILLEVKRRPNPQIALGAVDASCALLVCDATQADFPIVYSSSAFQDLTGYEEREVLGSNCRFLQSPLGPQRLDRRPFPGELEKVLNLKDHIQRMDEVQEVLVNYRKGGIPFLNLLTVIPIAFDSHDRNLLIGFQANVGVPNVAQIAG